MGLLDDAIRDHLDLKRRRGADPTEVERAEREALGPVRRGPESFAEDVSPVDEETALFDDAAPVAEPLADELPAAPQFEESFADDDLYAEDDDEWLEEDEHPPLTFETPAAEAPPAAAPAPAPVPAPPAPEPEFEAPAVPAPGGTASDETVEYRVEDALAGDGEPGEEDVLEETPEFLQDTPDHDRLWFEQRPPRDFDFDG